MWPPDVNRVRPEMREALLGYINHKHPVGGFLTALLMNDLKEAFTRADAQNFAVVGDYVTWLYNYAPSPCWGSPEKVRAWLAAERSWVERGFAPITWEKGV